MPQVVDAGNLLEVTRTGVVPEFKAPEAPKPEAKPTDPVTTEAKPEKVEADKPAQPRGEDGKFKAEGEKPAAEVEKKPEDDDDVKLTKKIERIIAKKHRAQKEAEEFATSEARKALAAEQRAADLQRQIDELRGTKSDGAKPDGEPKPEDFKTVGEYTRALVKWEAKQAGQKSAENQAAERQQAQANEVIGRFVERQEAFMKATPDYEEVIEAADFEVPPAAQRYLIESEVGPQLAYHLAKNPEVVTSLRKLSPARQLAELGKLEAKLETVDAGKTAPAPSPVSKAPAPIQPLEAKSTPVQKDPSQMSFQELRAYRREQERASARR